MNQRTLSGYFFAFLLAVDALGCSSFLLDGNGSRLMGKNYDWNHDSAYLLVNKRAVSKQAPKIRPDENPALWKSQYGSVSFNQYGQEFPNGGLNEAGLAVEILWLDASEFEKADERPTVNELTWIQYQLDNFSSTEEVVGHLNELRISNVYAKVHYFVCDKTADCAVIEWLKGKAVVHRDLNLPYRAITNHTYAESRNYLRNFVGFGGSQAIPTGTGSLARFVRAVAQLSGADSLQGAFQILQSVMSATTVWRTVYDLKAGNFFVATNQAPTKRRVNIAKFDFSCHTPVLAVNIHHTPTGYSDLNPDFRPYTALQNQKLLQENLADIPMGAQLTPLMAAHPETNRCEP